MQFKGENEVRYSIIVNSKPLKPAEQSENEGFQSQYEFLRKLACQGSCAIILPENGDMNKLQAGLAVQIIENENESILHVESECHVTLTKTSDPAKCFSRLI